MPGEEKSFLDELRSDQDVDTESILDKPLVEPTNEGQTDTQEEGTDDEGDQRPRNRRERRLLARLNSERESNIFMAGKLAAKEEAKEALDDADYLRALDKIYGTDTPEAQLATDLLRKAIVGARDDAEQRAIARLQAERQREIEAEHQASTELDSYLDEIEDTYGVELTEAQEKGYFALLQKMSPKDANGEVVAYADPHAVWDVFKDRLKKRDSTQARAIANRSMAGGTPTTDTKLRDDVLERALRDNGII